MANDTQNTERPGSIRHPNSITRASGLLVTLLCGLGTWAHAQTDPTLATVTVKPPAAVLQPSIASLSDEAAERTPLSTQVITADQLAETGARRLKDVLQFDASATDAYNAIGYWDYVTLRGFVIDQNQNYRREGLPISAETSIALDNKDSIEILKGTSGVLAGTSAPGGLVSFTVKRPTETDLRRIRLDTGSHGGGLVHVDLGGRFGPDRAFGYRLNVATEAQRNHMTSADGQRHLFALAMDWRLQPGSLLEVEMERSQRRQPGVPGLSLTGNQLPAPNPFTNINNQPWSQPGLMKGLTGSVRYEQVLNADWRWSAHAQSQTLRADDFLAYPYGCYEATTGTYYADRYCPNGDLDLYDYRSVGEVRKVQSWQLQARGNVRWAGLQHQLTVGVLKQHQTDQGQPQADNNAAVGTGNIYTLPVLPPAPYFGDPYTERNDRSSEWYAYNTTTLSPELTAWTGLRHSRLARRSVRTDGSRATAYGQGFTTPWLALAWQHTAHTMAYASWGQGVESFVAPGRSRYTNAGEPLAPLKSRQWEIGLKQQTGNGHLNVTWFEITRPRAADAGTCDTVGTCTFQLDGNDHHRGLELSAQHRWAGWLLDASALILHARRINSTVAPGLNGQRPTNVPKAVVRAGASHAIPGVPGLSAQLRLSCEGQRAVVPDGSVTLPSWSILDVGLTYRTRISGTSALWRLGVSNVADKRYFREAPYQYGHVYLFPGAPRAWRFGLEAAF